MSEQTRELAEIYVPARLYPREVEILDALCVESAVAGNLSRSDVIRRLIRAEGRRLTKRRAARLARRTEQENA